MRLFRLHIVLIIFLTALLQSCYEVFMPADRDEIIVEGWIEEGECPVVILTRSLPVRLRDDAILMEDLSDYVERWAKVTVSDGQNSVILTGGSDDRYVPGYIYTTSALKGEAGRTYTLTVETRGKVVNAVTTIPQYAPAVDSVVCTRLADDPQNCQITAYLRNIPDRKEYFRSFYLIGDVERQFISSYLGVVDDEFADPSFTMPIIRGATDYDMHEENRYFPIDTLVSVKISVMDEVSYGIWIGFEENSRFSSYFLSSSVRDIPSNITGGRGYWCGYNSFRSVFTVTPGTYAGNITL